MPLFNAPPRIFYFPYKDTDDKSKSCIRTWPVTTNHQSASTLKSISLLPYSFTSKSCHSFLYFILLTLPCPHRLLATSGSKQTKPMWIIYFVLFFSRQLRRSTTSVHRRSFRLQFGSEFHCLVTSAILYGKRNQWLFAVDVYVWIWIY